MKLVELIYLLSPENDVDITEEVSLFYFILSTEGCQSANRIHSKVIVAIVSGPRLRRWCSSRPDNEAS